MLYQAACGRRFRITSDIQQGFQQGSPQTLPQALRGTTYGKVYGEPLLKTLLKILRNAAYYEREKDFYTCSRHKKQTKDFTILLRNDTLLP